MFTKFDSYYPKDTHLSKHQSHGNKSATKYLTMTYKNTRSDFAYLVQLGICVFSGGAQVITMQKTTEGTMLSWLICWWLSTAINIWLSLDSHKANGNRGSKQMLAIYSAWGVVVSLLIAVFFSQADVIWRDSDTILLSLTLVGTILGATYIKNNKLRFDSPFARGLQSILLRVTPQLFLCYTILTEGGDGFSIVFIVLGHIAVLTRLGVLHANKHEVANQALRKSEIANWVTWGFLTLIWMYDKIK